MKRTQKSKTQKSQPTLEVEREPKAPKLSVQKINHIKKVVFVNPSPKISDLIFVFGYGENHLDDMDWKHVARLSRGNHAKPIIVNGLLDPHVARPSRPISHMIRDRLVREGADRKNIIIQDRSKNTLEDVQFAKAVLDKLKIRPQSITYVCKSHHSCKKGKEGHPVRMPDRMPLWGGIKRQKFKQIKRPRRSL